MVQHWGTFLLLWPLQSKQLLLTKYCRMIKNKPVTTLSSRLCHVCVVTASLCVCPQVAHMTKSEMHLHDLVFLGPGLLFLDQYFNSFIDEYLVLWIALVSS